MKKAIDKYLSHVLLFILGAVVSAYSVVRFVYLPTLERIQIRNSSMEAYKAISTLQFIRENKIKAATEFLEWQADEGLMGLHYYTSDAKRRKKLDSFAIQALVRSGKYRATYPRETKTKITDKIVNDTISSGVLMSKIPPPCHIENPATSPSIR